MKIRRTETLESIQAQICDRLAKQTMAAETNGDLQCEGSQEGSSTLEEGRNYLTPIPLRCIKTEPICILDDSDDEIKLKEPTYSLLLPSKKRGEFAISDLVWAKMEDMPWWPALLMDASHASDLARECQKKDKHLVAYFGSDRFEWCKKSQLKPFFENFSRFKTQKTIEQLHQAVELVLKQEVSRRFEHGTICSCLDGKVPVKDNYKDFKNLGVDERFTNYPVNKGQIVNCFNPKGLVSFIRDLALVPFEGRFDKLGFVMACSQIKTFKFFSKPKDDSTPDKNAPKDYSTPSTNEPKDYSTPVANEPKDDSTPDTNEPKADSTPDTNEPKADSTPDTNEPKDDSTLGKNEPEDYSTPATNEPKDDSTPAPKKRKRGRPRKTPSDKNKSTPSNKNKSTPSNKNKSPPSNENKSLSPTPKRQKLIIENKSRIAIIPVVEKRYDEWDPTALLLNFSTKYGPVPAELDLKRIFSKYGALKGEIEKGIEGSLNKVKIVFKKRADADLAFGGLRKDNLFEQTLISYRLVGLNEMEKKSIVPNGEDLLCPENAGKISSTIIDHDDVLVSPNPNPDAETTTMESDDALLNPNPNLEATMESDATLVHPNPNPNPNPSPEPVNAGETLVNPNQSNSVAVIDKTSPVWQALLNMDGFKIPPKQDPHFNKLLSQGYSKVDCEAQALGLMVKYARLVESIPLLSLNADVAVFQEKLSQLDDLDGNGFDVNRIRTCLNTLIQLKTDSVANKEAYDAERKKTISQKEEEIKSLKLLFMAVNQKIEDICQSIEEENEVWDKFRVERDEWLVFTRENRVNISRLEREIQISKKLDEEDREEFKSLAQGFEF